MYNRDLNNNFGQFHFTFDREYDHAKQSEAGGLLGVGWKTRRIPYVFKDENENYTLEFSKGGNVVFQYDLQLQQYVNIKKRHEQLVIDINSNEYVFQRYDGTFWHFNLEATADIPAGNLVRIDRGSDSPIAFEYESQRLAGIKSYRSETNDVLDATLHFTYESTGRVTSLVHLVADAENELVNYEKVDYSYYGDNESHGSDGDLKTVTHSTGSGDSWDEIGTNYYRYYKDDDSDGQAHDMKMAFEPEDFDLLRNEFGINAFSVGDEHAALLSSRFFRCDIEHRVVHESAFHDTYALSHNFVTYGGPNDRNAVKRKIIETRPGNIVSTVLLNGKDEIVFHEEAKTIDGQTDFARHYTVYDGGGNVLKVYEPEAILGYTLVDRNGGKYLDVQVSPDHGKITTFTMLSSEEKAKRTESKIQKGNNGTPITLRKWNYVHHSSGGHSEPRLSKEIVYPNENGSSPVETCFEYELYPNSTNIRKKTTRLPIVSASENGTGQQATTAEIYDEDERPVWTMDEPGIISHFQYDMQGRLVKQIADVDASRTETYGETLPGGWTTATGAGKHGVTEYEYDFKGRLVKVVRPENSAIGENGTAVRSRAVTRTVYDDANRKTLSASGYEVLDENGNVTSSVLANPVSMTVRDAYGNVTDYVQATRQNTNGPLTAQDEFPQATWLSWTKNTYRFGKRIASREYFEIPASGDGVKDVHYAETIYEYDARGRNNKTVSPIGTISRVVFDDRGNVVQQWVGTDDGENGDMMLVGESVYGNSEDCATCSGGNGAQLITQLQYVDDDTVRATEYNYDWRGRHTHTLGEEDAEGRLVYTTYTYDNLDRVMRSEQFLVQDTTDRLLNRMEQFYDPRGRAWKTEQSILDPANGAMQGKLTSLSWFDERGRQIKAKNSGENFYTHWEYDSLGRNVSQRTKLGTETLQMRETVYDNAGNAIVSIDSEKKADSNTLLRRYSGAWFDPLGRQLAAGDYGYPDAQNSERNSVDDCVRFEYNRIGEVIRKTDQNGTVHSYDYDNRGRLTADHVTTLGQNVDGKVRKIATGFTAAGNVETITSLDENDTAVNQVRYVYGTNGLLRWEFTAHDGEADMATTPYVEYWYGSVSGGMKPIGMKYPGGKELSYTYDTAGRVIVINEGTGNADDGGSSGDEPVVDETDVLVRYDWQGLGSAMKVEYVKPGLTLDYAASGALDRFGRIANHAWKNSDDDDVVRIQHGYDVTGNRLNRQDAVTPTWSESYIYDEMGQVSSLQRSDLNESWQYDPTGNWMQYTRNNIVENRNHNTANEILTDVVHDANGNMTQMPSPKNGSTLNCVYDAWNRLVGIGENIRYDYDGRNHRIRKTVGNVETKSYFNHGWQELESRTGDVTTTYVWGLRYIDDLVYRESDDEKLYSLADPNWNVVATVGEDGEVVERFKYDAFGKANGLTSDWNRTFTGQVLDGEMGLMMYRMRFYHPWLGRFATRDPIGYQSADNNIYRYIFNKPPNLGDQNGLGAGTYPEYYYRCQESAGPRTRPSKERKNECCEIAGRNENPNNDMGGVVCCDGEQIPCNWGFDPLLPNISKCTIEHEESHIKDRNLKPCVTGVYRPKPNFLTNNGVRKAECKKHQDQVNCMRKAKVNASPTETSIIDAYIEEIIKAMRV